jgi:predicted TIM-barrel fold metal-dependent hydrolase
MHREHPTTTWSSLDFVRNAVERRGAVGVKLYPPMGFAPGGNAALQKDYPDFWRRAPWLAPVTRQRDFGAKLDTVLDELFGWCTANEVPILAHANASVWAFPEFEELALAPHWYEPLASHPTLQVDFGHFGGAGAHSADFLARLSPHAGAPGSEAFVDASYFSEILDDEPQLRMILQNLFRTDAAGAGVLRERLLYGTDWKMLMQEEDSGDYLERFEKLIIEIDPGKHVGSGSTNLADAFFGRNSARFLGLVRNEPTRERLQKFYTETGMQGTPPWMTKVDALT